MANLTVINAPVAQQNGLDFFEFVWSDWGNFATAADILFTLPAGLTLSGLMIGPQSLIDSVILEQTFAYVGVPAPPTDNARAVESPFGAATGEGFQYTHFTEVSVGQPYIGPIVGPAIIRARNHTRWANAAVNGGYIQDGNAGARTALTIGAGAVPTTKLVLRCFLRGSPLGMPTQRQPLTNSLELTSPLAIAPAVSDLAIVPIAGRRRGYVEFATDVGPGGGGGIIAVKASLLRGGTSKQALTERSTLVEQQIIGGAAPAFVNLTQGGATNRIRVNFPNDLNAEWLLCQAQSPGGAINNVNLLLNYRFED